MIIMKYRCHAAPQSKMQNSTLGWRFLPKLRCNMFNFLYENTSNCISMVMQCLVSKMATFMPTYINICVYMKLLRINEKITALNSAENVKFCDILIPIKSLWNLSNYKQEAKVIWQSLHRMRFPPSSGPPSNTMFLRPQRVFTPNRTSIR